MRKLGIYVQVPFCQTKCTYCNFHTGVVASSRFAPYVEAVCREIRENKAFYSAGGVTLPEALNDAVAETIYIGGGTPSLLDPRHLQDILDAIRTNFGLDSECAGTGWKKSGGKPPHSKLAASEGGPYGERIKEVTLEADPETVEAEKVAAWVRAGINRVSFGVQSFVDKELVAAEHVSVYLLEIDEGSRLGKELLQGGGKYSAGAVPSEDEMAEFYEMAQEALGAAGYHHYEISNWAKPGFESKHNLKYWRREPYLGFGAGAHSFSGTERWANAHDAAGYVVAVQGGRLPVEQHETLTAESALEEELFLGLRQLDGIDVARIEREYGVTVSGRFGPLASAGLVERDGSLVRLAPAKLSVSNEVFVELMK